MRITKLREWMIVAMLGLSASAVFAKTLKSIAILPPSDGYHITSNTATAQFSAVCTYTDLSTDACSSVTLTWGSTDLTNMTVNSTGLVSGNSGAVGIAPDLFAYNGSITGHHQVRIDSYTPTSLTFRPGSGSSVITGLGTVVTAGAVDNNGASISDFCAWASSSPSIASVNNIGQVTSVAVGTTVVTCTYYGLTTTRTITVNNPATPGNVWFVRSDGGTVWTSRVTSGQCNGTTNAAYPGSGINQNCAVSNPMYCFTDESSSSAYTGIVQPGDSCVVTAAANGLPYKMGNKTPSVAWITNYGNSVVIPSGTPTHHTKLLGSNYASCTATADSPGNAAQIENYYGFDLMDNRGTQNIDIGCMDIRNFADCTANLTGTFDFACPNGIKNFALYADNFTANYNITNARVHGFFANWTGIPGPGIVWTNSASLGGALAGLNFDDPFGETGDRADGFTGTNLTVAYAGMTEELPKVVTSVSRDGAGNMTVVLPNTEMVNYVSSTLMVLSGMTPSDLNGTYPVSSIVFNQQSVSITGGTCTNIYSGLPVYSCTFTTSSAPAFGTGAFVQIAGVSPSFANGTYEVNSVSGSTFRVVASYVTRPGWTAATISSGGTAATANTVVVSAAGSAETASVVGTASHVHPFHRGIDQGDGGAGNGDAIGTGDSTRGAWICTYCSLHNNLQDGFDMLHSGMTTAIFSFSQSYSNQGQPVKIGNMDSGTIESSLMISNAGWAMAPDPTMPPDFNQYIGMPYRASDGFKVTSYPWSQVVISNDTFDSGQATIWDDFCEAPIGCATPIGGGRFIFQNNVILGFLDTNSPVYNGSLPGIYCGASCNGSGNSNAPWTWNNNISYNARNAPSGGSGNQWGTNPLVVAMIPNISSFPGEVAALTFDMRLTATSPAIAAGLENADVPATDYAGVTRPNPPSTGAYEFHVPPAALFSGSVTMSGSTVAR